MDSRRSPAESLRRGESRTQNLRASAPPRETPIEQIWKPEAALIQLWEAIIKEGITRCANGLEEISR
jgi:hypothetical protein